MTPPAPLDVVAVDDAAPEDLAPYRTLRLRRGLERESRFVAEGDKVVERLLESGFRVESVLATASSLERIRVRLAARGEPVRVLLAATREVVERVVGFADTSLKAVGRIAHAATVEDVLAATASPRLLVALDGLSNAENVGVVVRNAAALGAQAVIAGETSCSPFLTRAIRTSMGAVFRLPVVERESLLDSIARMRRAGVLCLAAHPAAAKSLPEVDLAGDCCVVLGSEGDGLSPAVIAACDERASIAMALGVDSLNVGSAAAAFLYEAWRQRRGGSRERSP